MIKFLKRFVPNSIKKKIISAIGSTKVTAEYDLNLSDLKRLDGKVALVTGGSGAIGSAICFRLAMEGALVGVCSRSNNKAKIVIDNIQRNGGKAVPVIMDLTDDNSVQLAIDSFLKPHSGLDILINNAGGSAREKSKNFIDQDFTIIEEILDMNLRGTLLCTHIALKYLKKEKTSRIINLSSVVGIRGKKGMTDYSTAKAGIIGFTKSLAIELGEYGVTVNCVSPGVVNQTVFDRHIDLIPSNENCLGHRGKTDDIAGTIAWLVSNDAQYITGQNIIVDGGRTLGLWGEK